MTCNQTITVNSSECCSPTKRDCNYSVTVSVSDTWAMPAVNDVTILIIPKCNNILPGSWLWNTTVGYLEVVKYNNYTGETVVKNTGVTGNVAPDTVIPSCMDFVVTAPVLIDNISDDVTCLIADFVSPDVGSTGLMSVRSTANLRKDYILAIDIYQYQVVEVIDNATIKVLNFGLGKTGVIDAPCDGSCLPVRVINAESPCLQDSVNTANGIVACVGGSPKVLVGTENNQFAYWDNTSGEWKLINSNIEADCTVTTELTFIAAGHRGPYLLTVKDATVLKVGDRVTLGEEHDAYVVSEVLSDTQLRLTKNTNPLADAVLDIGTRLCLVDCCDWIPEVVEDLLNRLISLEQNVLALTDTVNFHTRQIDDLYSTKADAFSRGSIVTNSPLHLSNNISPESEEFNDGVNRLVGSGDCIISLDTDLSKYDNTAKHFVVDGNAAGTGTPVYINHTDASNGDRTLNFRNIKGQGGTTISVQGSDIVIYSEETGGGSSYAVHNIGSGIGVYSGGNPIFNLRAIAGGTGIGVATNSSGAIEISSKQYALIQAVNADLPDISSSTVWGTKGKTSSATVGVTIANSSDSPMKVWLYGFLRTAFQLGKDGTYCGWVDMLHQLTFKQGNTQLNNTAISSITSQEMQKATSDPYHYVNNSLPILEDCAIATIPAGQSSTFTLEGTVTKDNYELNHATEPGGKAQWRAAPHLHLKVLAISGRD